MKTAGIIAEYNPFHKGHLYHLTQTKTQTGADFVIVIMSGNFVQRGTPAVIDKYTRTRMALEGGADAVFELPVTCATSSAELFSEAAISFFESIGITNCLCFGSEQASLSLLSRIARILNDEPEQYRIFLLQNLKEGNSYPRSVYAALTRFLLESDSLSKSRIEQVYQVSNLLSFPNNILGIEYLKALQRLGSKIEPCCIERVGSGYHDPSLTDELCSSTAIRSHLEHPRDLLLIQRHVPDFVYDLLVSGHHTTYPITEDDFSHFLDYCILTCSELDLYADMTKELASRIKNHALEPHSFSQWAEILKTKNITHTHINRALLHVILRITKEDMIACRQSAFVPYARLLGFKKEAAPLLTQLKQDSSIPIISKVADAQKILSPQTMQLFQKDLDASELYRRIVYHKYHTLLPDEYRAGVIRI